MKPFFLLLAPSRASASAEIISHEDTKERSNPGDLPKRLGSCGRWERVLAALLVMTAPRISRAADEAHPPVTQEQVEHWMDEVSNWGRWGKDDQLGSLNLIDDAKRRAAAMLVKEGVCISMSHRLETQAAADNDAPFVHDMLLKEPPSGPFYFDRFSVAYHSMVHTHLDALCHMFHRGVMYNGVPRTEVTKSGAAKLSVELAKSGLFTRAILLDVPRLRGVDYLEPGTPIYPADLDACLAKAGLATKPGDAILVRTGRWKRRGEKGPWNGLFAGLHASCGPWLHAHDVAILGSDAAADVMPSRIPGEDMPIHQMALVAMGIWILDACDFEAVSEKAAKAGRWEFLLTAAPLVASGGTGSPINPIATF